MSRDLTIRCTCGALQGVAHDVSPGAGNHAVCYCDDCQAFAQFLARAPDILDQHGGTEVFQMSPAKVAITGGADRLACMRLTERGLLRWYASCCNTPIANTMSTSKVPFIGLIHLCIQRPSDDRSLEAALGPVRVRGFRRSAKGDPGTIPAGTASLPLVAFGFGARMLGWKLRGDRSAAFFEARTGQPVVSPRVLSVPERDELRRKVAQSL
jgi:Family of unknown function (DUF6151)